jgi:hypothetical protein
VFFRVLLAHCLICFLTVLLAESVNGFATAECRESRHGAEVKGGQISVYLFMRYLRVRRLCLAHRLYIFPRGFYEAVMSLCAVCFFAALSAVLPVSDICLILNVRRVELGLT